MPDIAFIDRKFGGEAMSAGSWASEASTLSVADLIRFRVEMFYDQALLQTPASPEWLLARARAQATKNIPLETAVAEAQKAFARNAFFILVNGRQMRDLDERIALEICNEAVFLELTPLKGG